MRNHFARAIHLLVLVTLLTGLFPQPSEAQFLRGSVSLALPPSGLLTLPSDAMFIYSVAQQQGYSGPAVRLRRASDNTEQDFGWAGGRIDTASMNTFCASTSCFYSVPAYDQSGNGNHCTQATAANQPQYSPAAAVNGYTGVTFFTSTARCNIPSTVTASRQAVTVLSVDAVQASAGTTTLMGLDTTAANRFAFEMRGVGTTLQNNSAFLNSTFMPNAQMQFKAVTSSPSETRIYLNNRQSAALAASTNVTLTGGYWGRTDTGGYTYYGNAFLLAGYARTFTQSQVNAESAKLYGTFNVTPDNTKRVLFEGDSITWGQGSSVGVGYPRRFDALYTAGGIDVQNSAEPGKRMTAINGGKAFTVGYSYRSDYSKNVLSIFAGTNDMSLDGATASNIFTNQLVPYVQYAFTTGYNAVIVGTMLPRVDCPGSCETQRLAYNTAIVNGAATYGYVVADYAADSRLQNPNNTTYFTGDKIHLTDAGDDVIASIAYAAIAPVLAANDNINPNLFAANDNWSWKPRVAAFRGRAFQ